MTIDSTDSSQDSHKAGFIAVVGVPNVGKSTLMNAFLDQKIAIVSPRPQTTRSRQLGILTKPDAYQAIFVDTPGLIRKAKHALDEAMVDTVLESMEGADVILWLVDGQTMPSDTDKEVARLVRPLASKIPVILAINKIDMMTAEQTLRYPPAYTALIPGADWTVFSARSGAGVKKLLGLLVESLPVGPLFYPADQITDTFMRDIAGEMIREQLLLQLKDEIPHASAVRINEFKERENGMVYINGTILLERETHKKIVIGMKGAQIKRISTAARKEIETLLDSRVYLELRVKVVPKWRTNRNQLDRLGYI